ALTISVASATADPARHAATGPTTITSGCSRSRPTAYSFANSRPPWMSNARRASMCLPRQRSLESTSADHANVNGPENLAILRKLALNMLRTRPTRRILVMSDAFLAICPARDHGRDAVLSEGLAECIAVIGLVAKQLLVASYR